MATAPTVTDEVENITKCPICFETYKTPKYLPCSHTLCKTCLVLYITSVFKASSSNNPKAFPCPVCKLDVPVSEPCPLPEDIVANLPGNQLIVTLVDQSRLKSKDKLCDPCLVLEKHNKAVSWCTVCNEALCTDCDKYHKAMKVSKSHSICSLEEIQSQTKTITILETCTQHEGKKVKLYCMDHKQACCSMCVTVHHRKCDHVTTLNDAAKGTGDSPEIKDLTESLKAMIDELSNVLEGRKLNLQQLEKGIQQYQDKITRMRQDINKHLDLLEERVNQELGGRYKEASILISNDIAEIEGNLKVMSNYQNVIDTGLKNVSNIHQFLEVNKIKQQHLGRTDLLKKRLDEMKHHEVEIQFDDNWVNMITNLTKIGTVTSSSTPLDVRSGILGGKGKANLQNYTARKIRDCNVSTGHYLNGGIFLQNDKMLLVNHNGRKVIFCKLDGQIQKELPLTGLAWDIVQLDDREAAVVLWNTQNIQLIDIVNCTLGKLITVNKKLYRAIGYNGTNLIVGGMDNNIYMIDRTGNIIKTVASGYAANYITCTTDRIYLTSGSQLVCLDMNGSHVFSYTNSNFRSGEGISVDREGNIYCCGYSSNNIHQLTPDGQLIKVIVTNITNPRVITFDKTGERFLVTQHPNNVSVYELQPPV